MRLILSKDFLNSEGGIFLSHVGSHVRTCLSLDIQLDLLKSTGLFTCLKGKAHGLSAILAAKLFFKASF